MGRALMGTGVARAASAARSRPREMAISSPLLEDVSIDGATGILINITGGPDLTLHEVNEASTLIQEAAHEDANIIFGSVIDPNLSDEVRITVIATGFDRARQASARRRSPIAAAPPPQARRSHADRAAVRRLDRRSTKEYPAPAAAAPRAAGAGRRGARDRHRVGEPDIGRGRTRSSARSPSSSAPVPEGEPSQKMATGSGPARRSTARRSSSPIASARSRARA